MNSRIEPAQDERIDEKARYENEVIAASLRAGIKAHKAVKDLLNKWKDEQDPETKNDLEKALQALAMKYTTLCVNDQKGFTLIREFASLNKAEIVELMLKLSPDHQTNYKEAVRGFLVCGNQPLVEKYLEIMNALEQLLTLYRTKPPSYIFSHLHLTPVPHQIAQRVITVEAYKKEFKEFENMGASKKSQVSAHVRTKHMQDAYVKMGDDENLIAKAAFELAKLNKVDELMVQLNSTNYSIKVIRHAMQGFICGHHDNALMALINIARSKKLRIPIIPFVLENLLVYDRIPEFLALFPIVKVEYRYELFEYETRIVSILAANNRVGIINLFELLSNQRAYLQMIYGTAKRGEPEQVNEWILKCKKYYRDNDLELNQNHVIHALKGYLFSGYIEHAMTLLINKTKRIQDKIENKIQTILGNGLESVVVEQLEKCSYLEIGKPLLLTLTCLRYRLYESRGNRNLKRAQMNDAIEDHFMKLLTQALINKKSNTEKETRSELKAIYVKAKVIARYMCEYDLSYLQALALAKQPYRIMQYVYGLSNLNTCFLPAEILGYALKFITDLDTHEATDLYIKLHAHRDEKQLMLELSMLAKKEVSAIALFNSIALSAHQTTSIYKLLEKSTTAPGNVSLVAMNHLLFFATKAAATATKTAHPPAVALTRSGAK